MKLFQLLQSGMWATKSRLTNSGQLRVQTDSIISRERCVCRYAFLITLVRKASGTLTFEIDFILDPNLSRSRRALTLTHDIAKHNMTYFRI